jgi:ABC-type taurine transport system ATPase subunit
MSNRWSMHLVAAVNVEVVEVQARGIAALWRRTPVAAKLQSIDVKSWQHSTRFRLRGAQRQRTRQVGLLKTYIHII